MQNAVAFQKNFNDWLNVNPRSQNMKLKVFEAIKESLKNRREIFHLLNKGILYVAKNTNIDDDKIIIELEENDKHGIAVRVSA